MSKNLLMCYENGSCYFCKKLDCKNRVNKSGFCDTFVKMCDGNCHECNEAIRSSLYAKLSALKRLNENFKSCLMYQYLTEIKNFEFCGRIGKIEKYSKAELAVLQILKCYECKEKKKYFDMLVEISAKIKEIPSCFESMTDLTSTKALSSANNCILEVLDKEFECKEKIILKRLIKEYLAYDESKIVNFENMCKYIISKQESVDYYIHPLTLNLLFFEIKKR